MRTAINKLPVVSSRLTLETLSAINIWISVALQMVRNVAVCWVSRKIIQVLGIFQNFSKSLQRFTKQVATFWSPAFGVLVQCYLHKFTWTAYFIKIITVQHYLNKDIPNNVAAEENNKIKTLKQWRGLTCKMYASKWIALNSLWLQNCSLFMKKTSPTDLPLSVSMTLSSSQSILLPTRTLQTSGDAFWEEKKNKKSSMKIKIANW